MAKQLLISNVGLNGNENNTAGARRVTPEEKERMGKEMESEYESMSLVLCARTFVDAIFSLFFQGTGEKQKLPTVCFLSCSETHLTDAFGSRT